MPVVYEQLNMDGEERAENGSKKDGVTWHRSGRTRDGQVETGWEEAR